MSIRPRRSVLYMPGSNARAIEKAKSLPADAVVLDLEDSVAPDKKVEARIAVIEAVNAGGYGKRELIIRVNSPRDEWGADDLTAVAKARIDGVCLPKVESADEVQEALRLLNAAGAPATLSIWTMIETPAGVMQCAEIAGSSDNVEVLVMGTTDLAKELRVSHTPERLGLQYSLGQCVLAARLHGKEILDGVYIDLDDDAGFQYACEQGRELGFDGKTLIHPRQIDAANVVFGPSEHDIQRAHRILDAWKLAQQAGKGVAVVDGKLVEAMHIDESRRLLSIADAIQARID